MQEALRFRPFSYICNMGFRGPLHHSLSDAVARLSTALTWYLPLNIGKRSLATRQTNRDMLFNSSSRVHHGSKNFARGLAIAKLDAIDIYRVPNVIKTSRTTLHAVVVRHCLDETFGTLRLRHCTLPQG